MLTLVVCFVTSYSIVGGYQSFGRNAAPSSGFHENITYLLTAWCRALLEKLTGLQLVKHFPAFHGTGRFITALTSVRHLSLSWASPIQSIYPHPISWRSILILSTHLRLGLPSSLLPSYFPSRTLYTPLSSPIRATCPAHFHENIISIFQTTTIKICVIRFLHFKHFIISLRDLQLALSGLVFITTDCNIQQVYLLPKEFFLRISEQTKNISLNNIK